LHKATTFPIGPDRNELREIGLGFEWIATHNSKVELQDERPTSLPQVYNDRSVNFTRKSA